MQIDYETDGIIGMTDDNGKFSYVNETSVIPMGMKWRAGINDPAAISPNRTLGDPGAAIAQAFIQGLNNKPPKVEIPEPRMSKQDQYWRDLTLGLAPIPTFGVKDTRPETPGELKAALHPQQINEPAPQTKAPNEFEFTQSGKWIGDTDLVDVPVNGFPDITM